MYANKRTQTLTELTEHAGREAKALIRESISSSNGTCLYEHVTHNFFFFYTDQPTMVGVPNGTAAPEVPIEHSSLPPVVGINFGNSYASIAVFTKVSFSLAREYI